MSVVGHDKSVLLSGPEIHARLVDGGYKCELSHVGEALTLYEPLRQMVDAQRRRREHNEAAVRKWEQSKRATLRRSKTKTASRSGRAKTPTQTRTALQARSAEGVHYNPYVAAMGGGGAGPRGGVGYVRYETQSGLRIDSSRQVGPVSQQSWYHGAKQVAEATWAMQTM